MPRYERTIIEAAKHKLREKKGKEPRAKDILEFLKNTNNHRELSEIAWKIGHILPVSEVGTAKENVTKPHHIGTALLKKILERWETAERENGKVLLKIPLYEVLVEGAKYSPRNPVNVTRYGEILEALGIGKIRWAPNIEVETEESKREEIEELFKYFDRQFPRPHDSKKSIPEILEELAREHYINKKRKEEEEKAETAMKNEEEEKTDLTRGLEFLASDDDFYRKFAGTVPKGKAKEIATILDPRYMVPQHLAVILALRNVEAGATVRITSRDINKHMPRIQEVLPGGPAGRTPKPNHFRALADDVRKRGKAWEFVNVRKDAVETVLKILRKKHRGIDQLLKELEEEENADIRQGEER